MNTSVNTIKREWLHHGVLPPQETFVTLMQTLLPGRERQAAVILMEIAQGHPRLHDGETRHFLRARNQVLLEQSFLRSAKT